MRGVSVLIAYLLVLGAIITFGIASLMALPLYKTDAVCISSCGCT